MDTVMQQFREVASVQFWVNGLRKVKEYFGWKRVYAPIVPDVGIEEETEEGSAIWDFKTGILDRLDEYFDCMRRLRRHDPDAYSILSRVGLSIPAQGVCSLPNLLNSKRLTFGGVLFSLHLFQAKKDKMYPSFVYFKKIETPGAVQWFRGDVYQVVVIYDTRRCPADWRSRLSFPLEFHVGVGLDGVPRLLKELHTSTRYIVGRKGGKGKKRRQEITSRVWNYPQLVRQIAHEHQDSADEWASLIFRDAFFTSAACLDQVIVRVKSGGLTAAFGIEASTAKAFFRDRESTVLARDGKRKRIFHSVVQHDRRLGSGRITEVKTHYRGLRHFDWQSYQVHIVLPKNNYLLKWDGSLKYADDIPETDQRQHRGMRYLGRVLDEKLSG